MKYVSIQSQLRRFGGAVLRAKIKKMSLKARFYYFLKVAALENLNPVTARYIKRNFQEEIKAMVLAGRRFGVIVMNDPETMDYMIEQFKALQVKKKEA